MLKIGHRGAAAHEPENTIRSFRRALDFHVNAIEFDVRRTSDSKLVVIHDDNVARTTNGKGLVGQLTLDEIKQPVTEKGERVPALDEVLDLLDRKVKMLIELKETGLGVKLLDMLRTRGLEDNVVIISFLEDALSEVRNLNKEVETGLIYVRHKNPIEAALRLKADYVLPLYRFTHTANIQTAHDSALKVIVWTVNTTKEAMDYARKGVNGITSDRPDVLE